MNKRAWIIIFSSLLAASAVVVALVIVGNNPTYLPVNLEENPAVKDPDETDAADEDIIRLDEQLKADDPDDRLLAVYGLVNLAKKDPERLGPVLVQALSSEDAKVRFVAANKLGGIKYAPAAGVLTSLLDDPNPGVSVQAIESLAKLEESGLKAVMQALRENRIKNIDGALDTVGRITEQSFGLGEKGRRAALKYWAKQNK